MADYKELQDEHKEMPVEQVVYETLQAFESHRHNPYLSKLNIEDGLEITRYAYNADLATILIMDIEIGVLSAMEIVYNDSAFDANDFIKERRIGQNLFRGVIIPDEPASITLDQMKDTNPAEYVWMEKNGINEILLSPIRTRAALVGFIGVINPRRMNGDCAVLDLSMGMLNGEVRALLVGEKLTKDDMRSRILEDNDVIVNMFGGFEVRTNMGRMRYLDFSSTQCCLMLIYLIIHRDRIVSVRELAEMLWPDQLFNNPYNMVKGVAFRLRKLLSPICDKSIIVANHGTYSVNDELHIVTDMNNFTKVCDLLERQDVDDRDRLALYERAIAVYKGDLLPNVEGEIWLLGRASYYQLRYLKIIKEYLCLLEETGNYEKFFFVAAHAMNVTYADGDIYYHIISVMVRQNRLEMARSTYLKVETMLSVEQKRAFTKLWSNKTSRK